MVHYDSPVNPRYPSLETRRTASGQRVPSLRTIRDKWNPRPKKAILRAPRIGPGELSRPASKEKAARKCGHSLSFVASSPSRTHRSPEQITSEPKPPLPSAASTTTINEGGCKTAVSIGSLPLGPYLPPGRFTCGEHGGGDGHPPKTPSDSSELPHALIWHLAWLWRLVASGALPGCT